MLKNKKKVIKKRREIYLYEKKKNLRIKKKIKLNLTPNTWKKQECFINLSFRKSKSQKRHSGTKTGAKYEYVLFQIRKFERIHCILSQI